MDEETFDRGQRALAVAPVLNYLITEHTAHIVSRLTSLYNSGRLTPEAALAGIAEIASMDKLVELINQDIQRAQRRHQEDLKRANGTAEH